MRPWIVALLLVSTGCAQDSWPAVKAPPPSGFRVRAEQAPLPVPTSPTVPTSPPTAPTPAPSTKPDAVPVGFVDVVNTCSVYARAILVNALIRGKYGDKGSTSESLTLYNIGCSRKGSEWDCSSSAEVSFRQDASAPGRFTLGVLNVGPMRGVEVATMNPPLVILTHGVSTFTIDLQNGTIEHRDRSGSGRATCDAR